MTDEMTFAIDGVTYTACRQDAGWELTLRRSLVPVRHEGDLDLLAHQQDGLVPCRVTCEEDSITLCLSPVTGSVPWVEVLRRPRADVLRSLMNAGDCARLLDRGYTVVLDPGNLMVDRNLRVQMMYRGLAGVMPPQAMDAASVLRQYQALAISAFSAKASFAELVEGAMTLRRGNEYEQRVLSCQSVDQLVDYLAELYDETAAHDDVTLVRVNRRAHTVFKHATIWLAVVAVVACAAAVRTTFVTAPFQERLLTADMHYVKHDFDAVIETLTPVAVGDLPVTQRFELASSYLRSANLTEDQKASVENTLSITGDEAVLTYWVQIGRGRLDDALDNAKGLNDVDLILYAITLLQEQVGADTSLSGTERETRLDELQTEYDKYFETRTTAVAEGSAQADDAATTSGEG